MGGILLMISRCVRHSRDRTLSQFSPHSCNSAPWLLRPTPNSCTVAPLFASQFSVLLRSSIACLSCTSARLQPRVSSLRTFLAERCNSCGLFKRLYQNLKWDYHLEVMGWSGGWYERPWCRRRCSPYSNLLIFNRIFPTHLLTHSLII